MARAALLPAWSALTLALVLSASGCGEEAPADPPPAAPPSSAARPAPPPADAAAPRARDAGAPTGGDTALAEGEFHLDEPSLRHAPATSSAPARRRIAITLRSTPPEARVLVDGTPVGHTPAYWEGRANGAPREFTFVLPGYEMARYRFVPTRSGIVHATLERLPGASSADAGPAPSRDEPPENN